MSTESELAWAAGFFDGEGHSRSRDSKKSVYVIQVSQKQTDCLRRLQNAVGGLGTIRGPYRTKYPIYFWDVCKTSEADTVMNMLWPYLSKYKKEQALKAGFIFGKVREPKIGRPPTNVADLKVCTCHPERKHVGNGLCGSCYQMAWRKQREGK
jgi:hypothetical protein